MLLLLLKFQVYPLFTRRRTRHHARGVDEYVIHDRVHAGEALSSPIARASRVVVVVIRVVFARRQPGGHLPRIGESIVRLRRTRGDSSRSRSRRGGGQCRTH